MPFIRIHMMAMDITDMVGAAKNRRRASQSRFINYSRRLGGRNEETWEGARYVRPPVWTKNILRKRYLA